MSIKFFNKDGSLEREEYIDNVINIHREYKFAPDRCDIYATIWDFTKNCSTKIFVYSLPYRLNELHPPVVEVDMSDEVWNKFKREK